MLARRSLPLIASASAALLLLFSCAQFPSTPSHPGYKKINHWTAYYNDTLPASTFNALDLVVFDRKHHPKFRSGQNKPIYLSYVTIGEMHHDDPELEALLHTDEVLYHNTTWDSYAMDLSSERWRKIVLKQVDNAVSQGFDGVMLDTVDSPLDWARKQSPERYQQMTKDAQRLISEIRTQHPHIKIMLNRGFDIAPEVAGAIDYLLAESILTQKDNSTGQFSLFPPITYANAVAQLQAILARAEHLQLVTLDYWDVGDVEGVKRIYAKQRASGFAPYVTTQDLRRYTPEPLDKQKSKD